MQKKLSKEPGKHKDPDIAAAIDGLAQSFTKQNDPSSQ